MKTCFDEEFLILLVSFISLVDCKNNQVSLNKNENMENIEYLTIGGGCFWCVESCFNMLKGVETVESGYSGGHKENPTYEEVCTGETGHAEVVQIAYRPNEISFEQLMEVFFFLRPNSTQPTRRRHRNTISFSYFLSFGRGKTKSGTGYKNI